MARPEALTREQAIVARNRANAKHSTGPRTEAGKRRSSKNAITHGLTAQGPTDAADMADRDRRSAAIALDMQPETQIEEALVDRIAAAFQRLEKADHFESQIFDGAIQVRQRPQGVTLSRQRELRQTFELVNRYRGTAANELVNTLRVYAALHKARRDLEEAPLRNEPSAQIPK